MHQPAPAKISPSTNPLKPKLSQKTLELKRKVSVAHIRHLSPRDHSPIGQLKGLVIKKGDYSALAIDKPFTQF